MRSAGRSSLLFASCCMVAASVSCGAVTTSADGGIRDGGRDASDAGADGGSDTGCAGEPGLVALVVKNVHDGCTVHVDGNDIVLSSGGATLCQRPGTFSLAASPNSDFVLGTDPWHDTTTASDDTATVTVTSVAKCVWVCCPGAGTKDPCPTSDQCP